MTKANKRLVIVLVTLVVAAGMALEAYRLFDRRAITRETDRARAAALA